MGGKERHKEKCTPYIHVHMLCVEFSNIYINEDKHNHNHLPMALLILVQCMGCHCRNFFKVLQNTTYTMYICSQTTVNVGNHIVYRHDSMRPAKANAVLSKRYNKFVGRYICEKIHTCTCI